VNDLGITHTSASGTNFTAENPAHDWEFFVKWDGCVDITRRLNGGGDVDTLHICDVGELVEHLFQLMQEAVKCDAGFAGEWESPVVVLRRLIARLSPDERAELLKEGKP
jgi:hypothetical protein